MASVDNVRKLISLENERVWNLHSWFLLHDQVLHSSNGHCHSTLRLEGSGQVLVLCLQCQEATVGGGELEGKLALQVGSFVQQTPGNYSSYRHRGKHCHVGVDMT